MTSIFPYIGNFIIPIDFHIFQRGFVNHQPGKVITTPCLMVMAIWMNSRRGRERSWRWRTRKVLPRWRKELLWSILWDISIDISWDLSWDIWLFNGKFHGICGSSMGYEHLIESKIRPWMVWCKDMCQRCWKHPVLLSGTDIDGCGNCDDGGEC